MKAIEFQTVLHSSGTIDIPETYQDQLKTEQEVRVIVLIEDKGEDASWKKIVTKQFFSGYPDEDAIYDDL